MLYNEKKWALTKKKDGQVNSVQILGVKTGLFVLPLDCQTLFFPSRPFFFSQYNLKVAYIFSQSVTFKVYHTDLQRHSNLNP